VNTATQIQDQTSKNFPWTNALAYFSAVSLTEKKGFWTDEKKSGCRKAKKWCCNNPSSAIWPNAG
jgi:hypothetical protein